MKSLYNILLKLLFILFLTTNHLSAANMCYEKPVKTGICLGLLSIGCTTTTTIKNISDSKITDATIVHAFYGLDVGLINGIGIDGSAKTTKKDGDSAEVSGTLSDLTRLGGLVDLNLFGKGIVYRTGNYNKGATHSVYYKNLLSIDISAEAYLATYKIGNKEYSEKLDPCVEFAQGNLRDFTLRNPVNSRNILGDYQVIGNTVLCVKKNGSCYDYTGNNSNSELSLKYIDVDSDKSTYNSSQAKLSIPASAKIKWAAIYTQGHIPNKNYDSTISELKKPVKIKIPNISTTIDSTPKQIDMNYYSGSKGYTYSTYRDIPELVGKGSEVNGMVTVANIKASEGKDDSGLGNFGAWTIVVVYEDDQSSLKNISVFDGYRVVQNQEGDKEVTINVDGFITPTSGDIVSSVSIFAGEGDKNINGDKLYINGTEVGNKGNAFYSHITDDIVRSPSYSNNQGIDIQNFNVGTSGLNLVANSASSAKIKFTSTQDAYYPSLAIFSTELYEPRVCYKQEFFNELGDPIKDVKVGDTVTVHTWISNMKKDSLDVNLETADKVEVTVELDDENLEYIPNSIKMKNVYESSFSNKTDAIKDDLADFFFDTNTTKWRVGVGASSTIGGELTPNFTASNQNKTFVEFQVKLLQEGNININNIYKVSYENPQLGIRFGDESPLNIGVCADINTALGVGGVLGRFNIVNENGGNGSYNDPSSPETWLKTQVVNKPFSVKILSLSESGTALKPFTGNISVSLIDNPYDGTCGNSDSCMQKQCEEALPTSEAKDVTFSGSSVLESFNFTKATQTAFFRVSYGNTNDPEYACSVDGFSIRPDRFKLSAPASEDIALLSSAQPYNFSLIATQYGSDIASDEYNVSNVNNDSITLEKIIYMPNGDDGTATLKGTLNYTTNSFDIEDGSAEDVVGIAFTDVGKVNIKMIDKTWAASDIVNGDTIESCEPEGAWICGDINATFIPSHFKLSGVTVNNSDGSTFTYLSNDLNMSAPISLSIAAQNALNSVTQNFTQTAWENPVDISIVLPTKSGMVADKKEIDATQNLGFTDGTITIAWDETDIEKQLFFNYPRSVNRALNPFEVDGTEVTLNAISTYTATAATKDVTGTKVAENSATFIYGRSHAPRQRYTNNSGTALIYFESYCFGTDANGVVCDKALLPNGLNSRSTNDLRWFINSVHNENHGEISNVTQKGSNKVNASLKIDVNPAKADIVYDESLGYPYKTTMQNSASDWLIHNQDNPNATKNEFPVEFSKVGGDWSGKHQTDTVTKDHNVPKTNRRSMW